MYQDGRGVMTMFFVGPHNYIFVLSPAAEVFNDWNEYLQL